MISSKPMPVMLIVEWRLEPHTLLNYVNRLVQKDWVAIIWTFTYLTDSLSFNKPTATSLLYTWFWVILSWFCQDSLDIMASLYTLSTLYPAQALAPSPLTRGAVGANQMMCLVAQPINEAVVKAHGRWRDPLWTGTPLALRDRRM